VAVARAMMPLFGVCGVGLLLNPAPARLFASALVLGTFVGVPLWVHAVSPRALDEQGCTAGFGRRFRWSGLADVRVIAQRRGGHTVNHRFVLRFENGSVRFGYHQLANAAEVVAFLERVLKRKLLP